jgi:phosphoribosylglycinamide formyltransferase-1
MASRSSSKCRIRVCAANSGKATVLRAVIEAAAEGLLPIEFCGFITDRPCEGLQMAEAHQISTQCLDFKSFPSRTAFDDAFDAAVVAFKPDLLLLHYNRLVTSRLLSQLPGRVINTHYSLLPAFPGFQPIPRALEAGSRFTGVTIHIATERVDDGPILAQAACPTRSGDNESTLGFRLFAAAVPLTLGLLATAPDLTPDGFAKILLLDGTEAMLSITVPESLCEFAMEFVSRCRN